MKLVIEAPTSSHQSLQRVELASLRTTYGTRLGKPSRWSKGCIRNATSNIDGRTVEKEVPPLPPVEALPLPEGTWKSNLPVVGETLDFMNEPFDFLIERFERFGPVFKTHLFGEPMYVVANVEGWKETMVKYEFERVNFRLSVPLAELLQVGPHMTEEDRHTAYRRTMSAAFTGQALETYVPAIRYRVEMWLEECCQLGGFDLLKKVEELTWSFAKDIVVGLQVDEQTDREMFDAWKGISAGFISLPLKIPGTPFHRAIACRQRLLEAIQHNVASLKTNFNEKNQAGRHNVLYYSVLGSGDAADDAAIANTTVQMLIGAMDTSRATFAAFFTLYLGLPEHVQSRLREEQESIMAQHGDKLSLGVLSEMKYADGAIREVLRLAGPSRGLFREALQDFPLMGKRIPNGSFLFISTDGAHALDPIHRGADDYQHMNIKNLEASFRPERWFENSQSPMLTTFGAGPHTCLGMPLFLLEAKILVALFARGYDLTHPAGRVEAKILPLFQPLAEPEFRMTKRAAE